MRAHHVGAVMVLVASAAVATGEARAQDAGAPSRVGAPVRSDVELHAAIARAVRARAAPASVEAQVGRAAVINTARNANHRGAMQMVTILRGDGDGMPINVSAARDVVYWTRAASGRNVPVAGILWHRDGRVEAFEGWVMPP